MVEHFIKQCNEVCQGGDAGESATDPPELPLHDHHMNRARAEREYTHLYHMGDLWTQRRRPMEIVRVYKHAME